MSSARRTTGYAGRASEMRAYDYSRGYGRTHSAYRTSSSNRSSRNLPVEYSYGSEALAPEYDPYEEAREREERRRAAARRRNQTRELDEHVRRNRARAQQLSPSLIAFFVIAALGISVVLCRYITLRSAVTTASEEIASLQSELNDMKAANDQVENQVNNSINIDDVKYRAMTDLGMDYASGDQVIEYSGDSEDYMHQLQEVDGE